MSLLGISEIFPKLSDILYPSSRSNDSCSDPVGYSHLASFIFSAWLLNKEDCQKFTLNAKKLSYNCKIKIIGDRDAGIFDECHSFSLSKASLNVSYLNLMFLQYSTLNISITLVLAQP